MIAAASSPTKPTTPPTTPPIMAPVETPLPPVPAVLVEVVALSDVELASVPDVELDDDSVVEFTSARGAERALAGAHVTLTLHDVGSLKKVSTAVTAIVVQLFGPAVGVASPSSSA